MTVIGWAKQSGKLVESTTQRATVSGIVQDGCWDIQAIQ